MELENKSSLTEPLKSIYQDSKWQNCLLWQAPEDKLILPGALVVQALYTVEMNPQEK